MLGAQDLRKTVTAPFDQVLERVTAALAAQGFGVLTRIDVTETLRQKLGVEFERYQILGACNPPLAYRALAADREVGLLLPCNVIVYDRGAGQTAVAIFDPMSFAATDAGAHLGEVAQEARAKLARVIAEL
jgi:uncharacterized protein (DUF302 family)